MAGAKSGGINRGTCQRMCGRGGVQELGRWVTAGGSLPKFQYGGLPARWLRWRRGVAAEAPNWRCLTSHFTLFLNHGAVILCSQVLLSHGRGQRVATDGGTLDGGTTDSRRSAGGNGREEAAGPCAKQVEEVTGGNLASGGRIQGLWFDVCLFTYSTEYLEH